MTRRTERAGRSVDLAATLSREADTHETLEDDLDLLLENSATAPWEFPHLGTR